MHLLAIFMEGKNLLYNGYYSLHCFNVWFSGSMFPIWCACMMRSIYFHVQLALIFMSWGGQLQFLTRRTYGPIYWLLNGLLFSKDTWNILYEYFLYLTKIVLYGVLQFQYKYYDYVLCPFPRDLACVDRASYVWTSFRRKKARGYEDISRSPSALCGEQKFINT
jgi:hypothetical protein